MSDRLVEVVEVRVGLEVLMVVAPVLVLEEDVARDVEVAVDVLGKEVGVVDVVEVLVQLVGCWLELAVTDDETVEVLVGTVVEGLSVVEVVGVAVLEVEAVDEIDVKAVAVMLDVVMEELDVAVVDVDMVVVALVEALDDVVVAVLVEELDEVVLAVLVDELVDVAVVVVVLVDELEVAVGDVDVVVV